MDCFPLPEAEYLIVCIEEPVIEVTVDTLCVAGTEGGLASKLQTEIRAADLPVGTTPIIVGALPTDGTVLSVFVDILEPFPEGTTMTIGTDADPAMFVSSDLVAMSVPGTYEINLDKEYEGSPITKIFVSLPTASTQGKALVSIILM